MTTDVDRFLYYLAHGVLS